MMQNNKVFQLFKAWTKSYSADNKNEIKLIFDENTPVGFGSCNKDENIITVGIEPYKRNLISKYQPIKDSDFIRMGVTLFHELTHYEQKTQDNAVKEITISELSKYGNPDYYLYNHHRLLHEIDAEHTGIMTMWGRLSEIYPNKADKLMLDHLTDRVTNTVYMIDQPKEGFTSREQVETLFEQAYDNSVRELPPGFLRSDDETAHMLTTEDRVLRPEYAAIYNKLTAPPSGEAMDKMMSSLVSYIHPELQETYPDIDFDKLEPSHIFKVQMPETSEEIRDRLDLDDSFTKAVESLETKDAGPML